MNLTQAEINRRMARFDHNMEAVDPHRFTTSQRTRGLKGNRATRRMQDRLIRKGMKQAMAE